MEKMVTISVKIPKRLKERIKRSNIKVSRVVRSLLEEKVLDDEVKKLKENISRHKKVFDKISIEDVVRDIREDRDGR